MAKREPCLIDGCTDLRVGHGWCGRHYQRWRKYGDPLFKKPNLGNRTVRVMPTRRTCKRCGHEGPLDEFKHGRNTCKPCASELVKEWQRKNPEKHAANVARSADPAVRSIWDLRSRIRKLGLDVDTVGAYYLAHDGRCEICGDKRSAAKDLHIDHDHVTGEFRGMLCNNCNAGLGRFKDDLVRLESAANYLKRHQRG